VFAEDPTPNQQRRYNHALLWDILPTISVAFWTTVLDNGMRQLTDVVPYKTPFEALFVYVSGPLMRQDGFIYEWNKVFLRGDPFRNYCDLWTIRLEPVLAYINAVAKIRQLQAVVVTPGIGTGLFADPKIKQISTWFHRMLEHVLGKGSYPNIDTVRFINWGDTDTVESLVQDKTRTRSILLVRTGKGTVQSPVETMGYSSKTHFLARLVAWDPLSWPGNEAWNGSRGSDDGVSGMSSTIKSQFLKTSPATWRYAVEKGGYYPTDKETYRTLRHNAYIETLPLFVHHDDYSTYCTQQPHWNTKAET
jgi:hypothetical protein